MSSSPTRSTPRAGGGSGSGRSPIPPPPVPAPYEEAVYRTISPASSPPPSYHRKTPSSQHGSEHTHASNLGLAEIHYNNNQSGGPRKSNLGLLKQEANRGGGDVRVNPFWGEWRGVKGKWNTFKSIILIPVFLIRVILVLFIVLTCAGWSRLMLIGWDKKAPLSRARKRGLRPVLRSSARILLFVLGFYWIKVSGKRNKRAPVVVCNHTTMLDVVILMWFISPSFLSKASVLHVPLIGVICQALQVIGVERESIDDKARTRQTMATHVHHPDTPQLLVFPEGTTSRSDTMLRFKPGAFSFAQPVQPALLHYTFYWYDPSNTATTPMLWWVFQTFSQFYHTVELEFLPIISPNETEEQNPPVFAKNVREIMLKELSCHGTKDVFDSEQSVDDFMVWKRAMRDIKPIESVRAALFTHSLQSVRRAIGLSTPAAQDAVSFTDTMNAFESYTHSLRSVDCNTGLLTYAHLASLCLLSSSSNSTPLTNLAMDAFAGAWAEASVFPSAHHIPDDAMDVRRFITGLYYLSPLSSTWGDWTGKDLPDAAAFFRWFKIRARIMFALLAAATNRPRLGVSRIDAVDVLGEDKGGAAWDVLFGIESPPREFKLIEFRDLVVAAFFPPPSSLIPPSTIQTEQEEELWKKQTRMELDGKRMAAVTLLVATWKTLDFNWMTKTKSTAPFFLARKDEMRSLPETTLEDPLMGNPGDHDIAVMSVTVTKPLLEEGNNNNGEGGNKV